MIPLAAWPYWPLIRKALPFVAVALAALWAWLYVTGLQDDLAAANARVAALEAAGRAQAERVALEQAANDRAVMRLLEEKNATIAAIDADRVRLSDSLRDAYTRAGRGPVREADPGAIADAVAARIAGSTARADEIDAALDRFDKACRRDAERLSFWIGYATAMGVPITD